MVSVSTQLEKRKLFANCIISSCQGLNIDIFQSTSPQPIPLTPHSKLTTSDSTKMGPLLEDKTTVPSRFKIFLGWLPSPRNKVEKETLKKGMMMMVNDPIIRTYFLGGRPWHWGGGSCTHIVFHDMMILPAQKSTFKSLRSRPMAPGLVRFIHAGPNHLAPPSKWKVQSPGGPKNSPTQSFWPFLELDSFTELFSRVWSLVEESLAKKTLPWVSSADKTDLYRSCFFHVNWNPGSIQRVQSFCCMSLQFFFPCSWSHVFFFGGGVN